MKQKSTSKSSLFLLEMLLSILFFAIASSVCVQVFVKAHQLSQKAKNLNFAQAEATSVAEWMAGGRVTESMTQYYDRDWQKCSKEEAEFMLVTEVEEKEQMRCADILVQYVDKKEIFSMSVDYYIEGVQK